MRDIRASAERFIRVVQSDLVDGSGEQRYRFETDSGQTFAIKMMVRLIQRLLLLETCSEVSVTT